MSTFVPYLVEINAISNAQNAVVGFIENHAFSVGENVSFRTSKPYGMVEINNLIGLVLAITSNTITVNIDTSFFTPFVYPPIGTVTYVAVAVPSSSGIIPGSNPSTVNLEDAFDNQPD